MHTVRINTYNQNIAPQGTALPQANIPGGYHLDAYTARHLGNVSNALQDLAGLELRMKESRRADALNMARTSYLNDIIREEERLTTEDTDYDTQRERYVQFQRERRDFYSAGLDADLRPDFVSSILLPSSEREFQVGRLALAGQNDRILANANQQIGDLIAQSGADPAKNVEAFDLIDQMLGTLVTRKVISQSQANGVLTHAREQMRLNRWANDAEHNPEAVMEALAGVVGAGPAAGPDSAAAGTETRAGGNNSPGKAGQPQGAPPAAQNLDGLSPQEALRFYNRAQANIEAGHIRRLEQEDRELTTLRAGAVKEMYTLAFNGELTPEAVEDRAALLSGDDQRKFMQLARGEATLPAQSEPAAQLSLLRLSLAQDPELADTADDLLRSGRLTLADYKSACADAEKPLDQEDTLAIDEILRLSTANGLQATATAEENALRATRDFKQWRNSERGQKASASERLEMGRNIAANYRNRSVDSVLIAMTPPLNLVGTKTNPDLKASVAKIVDGYRAGLISDEQRNAELIRLKRLADVVAQRNNNAADADAAVRTF